MTKGRRAWLKQNLSRAVGNLEWYLKKMRENLEIVGDDNEELSKSFETLTYYAIILQEKTKALNERI